MSMSTPKESVDIILRDLALNPRCKHGPTILFSKRNCKKYFACAGLRSLECFYLDFENFNEENIKEHSQQPAEIIQDSGLVYSTIIKLHPDQRIYCKTCQIFIETVSSHEAHNYVRGISDTIIQEPSLFLQQLDDDKLNAQYFFDESTLDFICSMFDHLKIVSVICIGAPRLHDFIKSKKPQIKSILLDIDNRFKAFNQPNDFIQYNMFNNFFFEGFEGEKKLTNFLKDGQQIESQHCVFTDPPFAARTELLSDILRSFGSRYNSLNAHHKKLPMFWVFPYFNEHHIRKEMPEMEMLDFQVSYMNHRAFHNDYKGRKTGSPVRVFTNVDPKLIKYPLKFTNYRFCQPCRRFVSITNLHCKICKCCPSKNGSTYRHCSECIICVKPNYVHCTSCSRCVQKQNHDCGIFQKHQECWYCSQRGHVEKNCSLMTKFKRRKDGNCAVCKGKLKHNLKKCPSKKKFLMNY